MKPLHLSFAILAPFVAACTIGSVSLTGNGIDTTTTGGPGDTSAGTAGSAGTGSTGSDSSGEHPTTAATTGVVPPAAALDILFVIDNSGSMAEEQGRLNGSIGALLAAVGDRDLRIAITTTDAGNPRCPAADTSPEGGDFVLSSCVGRVAAGEFAIEQTGDDYSSACTDFCDLEALSIAPTATAEDPDPKPRGWLERTAGVANVDVPLADALACALPQGVSGCGFESPLEAMYLALGKAMSPDSPQNHGFLRPGADLVVVFLTDEMDCSYNPEYSEIFTSNRIFWEDPNAPASTSAVCFNAGAACVGGPGTYDSCNATNRDITGAITMDPEQAVLRPVSRYVHLLQELQATRDVHIVAIAGVPPGFETGEVPLVYADSPDPTYQDDFGIGPGCTSEGMTVSATAAPPMRLLNFAQAFGPPRFFSICDEASYDAAMIAAASP